jgi:hypothetical protein
MRRIVLIRRPGCAPTCRWKLPDALQLAMHDQDFSGLQEILVLAWRENARLSGTNGGINA